MNKPNLLLFDSNYICARARYGCPPLESEECQTHIIFNFIKTIVKLAEQFETRHVVFPFDSKASVRKRVYPSYKSKRNRDKSDEDKALDQIGYTQVDLLKNEVLSNLGFNNIMFKKGFESDDTMHQFCLDHHKKFNIIMVSKDADMFQSLDYCTLCWPVKVKNKTTWETYTKEDFVEQWGIQPIDWVDIKMLGGCKSDTVSGIPGVAEKTACKYLKGLMNQKTKTYEKIENLGSHYKTTNKSIVKLPLNGTPSYEYKRNSLSKKKFIDMCNKYEFISYLTGSTLDRWIDIFLTLTPKSR